MRVVLANPLILMKAALLVSSEEAGSVVPGISVVFLEGPSMAVSC